MDTGRSMEADNRLAVPTEDRPESALIKQGKAISVIWDELSQFEDKLMPILEPQEDTEPAEDLVPPTAIERHTLTLEAIASYIKTIRLRAVL